MRNIWKLLAVLAVAGGLSACSKDNGTSAPRDKTTSDNLKAVDLGLSVKWANLNIGAENEEDPGEYFAWGETLVKSVTKYTKDNYKFYDASGKVTKYCESNLYGTVDGKCELEPTDDAAVVNFGDGWRMPTYDECKELIDKCTFEVTTSPDYKLVYITATGPNGNKIKFVQRDGIRDLSNGKTNSGDLCLWTKTKGWDLTEEVREVLPSYIDEEFDVQAYSMMIKPAFTGKEYYIYSVFFSRNYRYVGLPIRAVKDN